MFSQDPTSPSVQVRVTLRCDWLPGRGSASHLAALSFTCTSGQRTDPQPPAQGRRGLLRTDSVRTSGWIPSSWLPERSCSPSAKSSICSLRLLTRRSSKDEC